MGPRFINIDRNTPMMLPPDLKDWIPDTHIVHFILDAVESLDLKEFKINRRGSGSRQYPPSMMLSLLIYCYATGRFRSREIESATYSDVAVRYICGGDAHPDHDTICTFRRENGKAFKECFVKVLILAGQVEGLKKIGGVSVDGTKIKANASKHAAVSYKRAGSMIKQLEQEIQTLLNKAEKADNTPLDDGLSIPDEITRREERKAKLEEAKKIIEERYQDIKKEKQAEYEKKQKARDEQRKNGKKPRGREPKPPAEDPPDKMQVNFTDAESRIMKSGSGNHFEQAYNAQAAVDTEGSMLILGQYVTNHVNDKLELIPAAECVSEDVREVANVLADTGYFSESAIKGVENNGQGPKVYCAVEKQNHHRTINDLLKKEDPLPPAKDAPVKEKMAHLLKTKAGKAKYKKRKETVEPVFGIIKSVLGFRQFLLRGLEKVNLEWDLVTLAYNFKRLYKITGGKLSPV